MKITELLNEETITIDNILSPEEQQQVINIVKNDGDLRSVRELVEDRLRQMGVNVTMNIGNYLKWVKSLDMKFNPEKYEQDDMSADAWDSYGKRRAQGKEQSVGPGGNHNWTGD